MIQNFINFCYRYPRSELKIYKKFGGYFSYRNMLHQQGLMKKASAKLPPVNAYPEGLPIYFLTGKAYLYQTLFCIQSLAKVTTKKFRFTLVDDGTFDIKLLAQAKKQLPGCTIITAEQIEQNLGRVIPKEKCPNLHNKRGIYPHIKKLTDIHTVTTDEWKLEIDSDMLFWHEPTALITWLENPSRPLHMLDCVESYGYSKLLMQQLSGGNIRPLINVGAIGLYSKDIPWQQLDRWVETLEQSEGKTYYLEQALTAMLIGDKPAVALNAKEYVVNPTTVNEPGVVLHHYVDISKKLYFSSCWKKIMNKLHE